MSLDICLDNEILSFTYKNNDISFLFLNIYDQVDLMNLFDFLYNIKNNIEVIPISIQNSDYIDDDRDYIIKCVEHEIHFSGEAFDIKLKLDIILEGLLKIKSELYNLFYEWGISGFGTWGMTEIPAKLYGLLH